MSGLPILTALARGACLTTAELIEAVGADRRSVTKATSRLVSAGEIVRRERGCFEISDAGREIVDGHRPLRSGPRGPLTQGEPRRRKRQTERDRMWTAMRSLKKVTLADLQTYAGAGRDNAMRYVAALEGAGILVRLRREAAFAITSNGCCRWLLTPAQDTGPLAPIVRPALGVIFDPNTGESRPIVKTGPRGRSHP